MFGKKRTAPPTAAYDPSKQKPAIRCGICTGEKTAGFIELDSGKFIDVQLIRSGRDLEEFKAHYGITGYIEKIY